MAFSKVLSGSLADDAVSGDNIAPSAYLENSANQNLSGTISQNRMYTSDSYTLTGDLTVNDTIGLISASGSGKNVTVMNDGSTRTITGSGTVEGGELYNKADSLTGMTGELGSTVTGAPALTGLGTVTSGTLGSDVTFPAGHVIGMWSNSRTNMSSVVTTNTGAQSVNTDGLEGVMGTNRVYTNELSVTVDVSSTSSDLYVIGTIGVGNTLLSNKGAYGMVLNIPGPTNNYAYQTDNYPFYPSRVTLSDSSSNSQYGVGKTTHASVKGSDNRVKAGVYDIRIYVYAYNETSPSGSQTINVYNSYITVFEIKR